MKKTIDYLEKLGETKIDFDFKRSIAINKFTYKKLPVVTICGTNGKGSTTAFLENILIEAGYKVGAYTSPHLEHIRERIRINGKNISAQLFEKHGTSFINKLKKQKITATYFEFLTFFALDVFEKEKIDIAVFEVGLGGKLDSVNAIPRIGAIMTSISMDHMDYLGDTLEKITLQKLPILTGAPFSVVSKQERNVQEVIDTTLKKPHITEGREFHHSGNGDMFLYQQEAILLGPLKLPIHGDHQSSNAACAVAMALHLQKNNWKIPIDSIVQGLIHAKNPGRIEKWMDERGREIWMDVAHNADSVQKLTHYLYLKNYTAFQTIFGCSSDKPFEEMIQTLKPITKDFYFVSTPSPRSWNPKDKQLTDPVDTIKKLIQANRFPILCAGSFYHLGQVRKALPKHGFRIE